MILDEMKMILDDWMYEERIGDEKGVPRRVQKEK